MSVTIPSNDRGCDAAWLLDMLAAARAVVAFVNGRTYQEYEQDLFFRSEVERQIEIIGEAARGISTPSKPPIPKSPGDRSWPSDTASHTNMAKSTTA